jgi:alpha-L-fucosidase
MNLKRDDLICSLIVLIFPLLCMGASAQGASAPVGYSTVQVISADDSPAVAIEKAAKVLPRTNQTAWMRLERTFFLHFGPNTFRGVEWGDGREDPSIFNPSSLDANQWVNAVKNAGGNLLILVSKHHDGLCLWPSRYTSHSVAASPWLNGKGDVVKAVAETAHLHGIKLGIYLSPADLYQLRTNPKNPAGYYGNGSPEVRSVIPTDVASFQSNPAQGRMPPPGFTSYTYEVDDYNRYFLDQLYELLTEYGPISEIWFDGANPDPSVHETYDYAAWYGLIRHLQPDAVIAVKGPDVRWVGNEGGVGRTTEWSVIPLSQPPERFTWPDMQGGDLGSREKLTPGSFLWWYPAEVNTPILNGWFWSADKHAKSPAELVDYFYRSVGRSGNMLLNLSPDTRGLIPDDQFASLHKMAQVINDTFAMDLAAGARIVADNCNPATSPSLAHDGNLDTWWEAAPGHTTATLTLTLPAAVTFDVVSLQEAVDHRSQRIESFVVETWNSSAWTAPSTVDEQTTVGHKRLVRLTRSVTTDQVRIRITGSRLEPTLAEIGLFKQSVPSAPVISDRSRDGSVFITHPQPLPILCTIDGTEPTAVSPIYKGPIPLPLGGTVQAAVLTPDGHIGLVASKTVVGLAPTGWKVVRQSGESVASSEFPSSNAIDADGRTLWREPAATGEAVRPGLTVDMGRVYWINGFAYLPRQDWVFIGVVDRYKFETSLDGVHWTTQVASGAFGNIRNNPVLQQVTFAPVEARFFRFTALHDVDDNGWIGAAEITVLPSKPDATSKQPAAANAVITREKNDCAEPPLRTPVSVTPTVGAPIAPPPGAAGR